MSEDKKLETIISTGVDGTEYTIVYCPEISDQLFVAVDQNEKEMLVLLHLKSKIGFAIPFEMAHQLSHHIHEALEHLTGGDIDDIQAPESEKKVTLH